MPHALAIPAGHASTGIRTPRIGLFMRQLVPRSTAVRLSVATAAVFVSSVSAFGQSASNDDILAILQQQAQQQTTPAAGQGETPDTPDEGRRTLSPDAVVEVSEFATVDLRVVNEDLRAILDMLGEQTRVNMIVANDVQASITATLYDVTFEDALDALLHVNGFGWSRRDNFIYVETIASITAREQEQRAIVHRVIQLDYLNAGDAQSFAEPLLSDVGVIRSNATAEDFEVPSDAPAGGEDYALASAIVVYDYAEHVAEIAELVEALDTRPRQVLVEAAILQTSLDEANAFGVDFALVNDVDFLDFLGLGGPLGAPSALTNAFAPDDNQATAISSSTANFSQPATLRASVIANDAAFFIRALDEVSDTTVLANPKILTLNRQPARVLVGERLGYLSTTTTETATTQTVEFLDVGIQLTFRPFISTDGMIRLELQPSLSRGEVDTVTGAGGGVVTVPNEITQELTTNVLVPDGATVVLGGLFREDTVLRRSQVPVLGDIPLVGSAFRGHDDTTNRSEVIFMITPTIMSDGPLKHIGEAASDMAERVRVGSRQGTLPFSRDRQTRNLNLAAEEAIDRGELDRANWLLRRSLELQPNQPEVRRLRERLFNHRDYWPSRSVLDSITTDAIDSGDATDDAETTR